MAQVAAELEGETATDVWVTQTCALPRARAQDRRRPARPHDVGRRELGAPRPRDRRPRATEAAVVLVDCLDIRPQEDFLDSDRHWTVEGNAKLGRAPSSRRSFVGSARAGPVADVFGVGLSSLLPEENNNTGAIIVLLFSFVRTTTSSSKDGRPQTTNPGTPDHKCKGLPGPQTTNRRTPDHKSWTPDHKYPRPRTTNVPSPPPGLRDPGSQM